MPKNKQKESVTRFFNAIDSHPRSSLYIVCDLILENSVPAKQSLHDIAQKILPEQLRVITNVMTDIEANEGALQDKNTIDAFAQFKARLLCDDEWLKHLNSKDVIALSANDEFCMHGLIALTRIHAKSQGYTDPFYQFDFEALQRAGGEHITPKISALIANTETLPLDNFKALSKNDIELARCILKLLQSHPSRFEMGEYFLVQHKELKSEIYTNWHKTKESIALTKPSEAKLLTHIEAVSKTHQEFSHILKTSRVKKDIPDSKLEELDYSGKAFLGLGSLITGAALVPKYVMLSKVALAGKAACTVGLSAMASPLIAPTIVAFVSGYMAYKCEPKLVDDSIKKSTKEPLPWSYELHKKNMGKPC